MDSGSPLTRELTVLFVDLVGSTQLYERIGDNQAFSLINSCIQAISAVVVEKNGRIVKHTGDGLMAVFAAPHAAADAAVSMHLKLRDRTRPPQARLAIRVGFHFGPVLISADDVFGETVNTAARLMELASPGRALTTEDTLLRLTGDWRGLLQKLPPRVLRGTSVPVSLFELKCESVGDVTILQAPSLPADDEPELRLYLGDRVVVVDHQAPLVHIGRDQTADLQVGDSRASRKHAVIELRGDKFMLIDRSSNGTFVSLEGEKEFMLAREEAVLRNKGKISLGSSCEHNRYAISFVCL